MPSSLTFFSPASVLDNNGRMYFNITETLSAGSSIVMLLVTDWKSKYFILSVIVRPFASRLNNEFSRNELIERNPGRCCEFTGSVINLLLDFTGYQGS